MWSRLTLFSGNSNPTLSGRVCARLGIPSGKALVTRFSDGEIRVEIGENIRGKDTYVLQSTCPPVNDNLMELLIIIDALKRASAGRITAIVPYYGYGRQDQKEKPRVPLSSKVVADLIDVAGANRVITIDLHAEQIQGFFSIPVDHVFGTSVFIPDLKESLRGDEIVVAPDPGGVERARLFASALNLSLALMDYRGTESALYARIVGNVRGKRVVILDDMIDTGRTLLRTAAVARDAGADVVDAYCVHAVLSGAAVENLEVSAVRSLNVTDTVPLSEAARASAKIRTVSIAPMLAETIRRVHFEESVSAMFTQR
jgi:ribose-phosphate pyrophosphokinase